MKKRIGNDISITLEVIKNGEAWDISNIPVSFRLQSYSGGALACSYAVDGNVISGTCYGKDQLSTGKYFWVLVLNDGAEDMTSVDGFAFQLVDHTSKEAVGDDVPVCCCCDIEAAETSVVVNTTTAKNGLSAYELAVQQGFSGTLDEWLASMVVKPVFSVGDDGYMYVETD